MTAQRDAFARYIATLGRGPGRGRALDRAEARDAWSMALLGSIDPHQLGAFLMLLRYRGEDAAEIAGMVEASADVVEAGGPADLDWPSYGAGRTRGAPWFLLAALALSRAGVRVFMHGTHEYSTGISVASALAALGLPPSGEGAFTFRALAELSPRLAELLGMRRLFGLRSPVNTIVRLLNPANAPAGVDGVFHPAYLDVHLGVAELLARPRLLVLKGGGGEAERVPLKPGTALLWDRDSGRQEIPLAARDGLPPLTPAEDTSDLLAAVWRGETAPPTAVATVIATIELALLAMGRAPDEAAVIWRRRLGV